MSVQSLAVKLFLPMLLAQGTAFAASCATAAKSGPLSTSIVELYTSEGCDSCPAADKWFSTIDSRKDGVVPLAFHVDYWDYIGWKDRFAKPLFTQRQRDTVIRQGSRTSYTPQVMLDGRDVGLWSYQSRFQSKVREIASRTVRANISIDAKIANNTLEADLLATVSLPIDRTDAAVFIAVTEDRLASRVTAGENKGALLKHDHVVRELFGPLAVDGRDRAEGRFALKRTIALAPDWKQEDLSLVAFVQNARTGEVLQALSTPLCRG